jgi:predicted helicase
VVRQPKPVRAKPRPHQKAAINDVKRGFKKHSKGQLIMACGTGKTLTGLWIKEALKAQRTLLLVPSISLVQQNLSEWGRHAKQDFECLVVCSDETVKNDAAVHHVSELGIDVTTDPADIATFLKKQHKRPVVVISTYHSSDRVSKGQQQAKRWFDLTICDEAHRLAVDTKSTFAIALDEKKIKSRKRLFMTATPRLLTERLKKKLDEDQLEIASMDDVETFGPEFHTLSFRDAIEAKPEPLLTEYQVAVVGVTNKEVQQWVRSGRLLRTKEGIETDAEMLASQIGLAKAIKQYDLEKIITFHSRVARAKDFVDESRNDSLPVVLSHLDKKQKLWARHISGTTPASTRRSLLNGLGDQPSGTTAIVSNCACLNEGVDVPALDGIAVH